ncbi:UNVERIFIED_CONTAM: hypothetical protein Slati_1206900 [Sesamum latifolium]|uniref:NERD domain-containing protein n=1 Tax=Sesamum latifolium TaxID=2727402 RepID=A0AAW2XES5_9LAMI
MAVIGGLVLYLLFKYFFYEDDTPRSRFLPRQCSLRRRQKYRLEKLYHGSKVYVGIQIPDPDSASRRNIDLVLVTDQEAVVISVKNLSGFVSCDNERNYFYRPSNLEYSWCVRPHAIAVNSSVPSVLTLSHLRSLLMIRTQKAFGFWISKVLHGGKDKMQESFCEKLNSVLSTAPISDRLELKGNRYVLGEFLEFKGKQEDLQALRAIKRSKVSRLSVQKISMLGFEGSSQREEVTVRSSTLVLFQPQNSDKPCKYKLSSVISLLLSA